MLISQPGKETIKSDLAKLIHEERGVNPPIGLLYVAASIKQWSGHEVKVVDAAVDNLSVEQIKSEVESYWPDVVGMTLTTFSLIESISIAKAIKQLNSDIKIIAGGIHIYIYPEETLKLGCFDYGVLGEAENIICPLLDCIEKGIEPSQVKGVVYKADGGVHYTGEPRLLEDLDSIPFPDRTMLPYKKYNSIVAKHNPVSIMITSRGCPYGCIFCDRPHLGKRFRMRSAENVVDEFEECYKLGIGEILVYDDTFTLNSQRVIDICEGLVDRGINISWGIRARVDTVNEKMIKALKKAGCVRVNYGVESGSPDILKTLNKGITLEQVEKAFAMTRKFGIDTLAYFMIGCPGDTLETIERTQEIAKKIKPSYAHFTILMPFPATKIYTDAVDNKIISSDVWREFAESPQSDFEIPVYEESFKREELIDLLTKCNKSFYLRPTFVIRELFKKKQFDQVFKEIKVAWRLLFKGK